MRLDGSTACMTIDRGTDTEVFRAYVRQVLGPKSIGLPHAAIVLFNLL